MAKQVGKLPSYEVSVQNHTLSLSWSESDIGSGFGMRCAWGGMCVVDQEAQNSQHRMLNYCHGRPRPDGTLVFHCPFCELRMSDLHNEVIYFERLSNWLRIRNYTLLVIQL